MIILVEVRCFEISIFLRFLLRFLILYWLDTEMESRLKLVSAGRGGLFVGRMIGELFQGGIRSVRCLIPYDLYARTRA